MVTSCGRRRWVRSRANSGVSTETNSGRKRRIWSASNSRLRPAANATTRKRSGKRETTSSVVTPTEPVEPIIEIAFIAKPGISPRRSFGHPAAEAAERHQWKVMRVHVVAQIEMIREASAGELGILPASVAVLSLDQPRNAAPRAVADIVFASDQSDQGPCGL